jgi:hypothetical protein
VQQEDRGLSACDLCRQVVSPYSLLLFGGRIFTESKKSLIKV